jgi:hypothetical protein
MTGRQEVARNEIPRDGSRDAPVIGESRDRPHVAALLGAGRARGVDRRCGWQPDGHGRAPAGRLGRGPHTPPRQGKVR